MSLQCEGSETVARNQQNNVAVYTQVRTGPVSEVQSLELRTWIRCVLHRYPDSGPHRILGNKIDQVLATDCCVPSIWLSVCAVLVSVRVIMLSLLSIKINNRKRIEYLHKRQDESNKSACYNLYRAVHLTATNGAQCNLLATPIDWCLWSADNP